jgi:ribosomal protein S18 acetylase RimI-like enzyme
VAEWQGSVVDFAQYMRRSAESVDLSRIYVLPDRQRGGVGTQLLEAGVAAFAQQGLRRLTVSVERDNRLGRRFYAKMGFVEVRELSEEAQGYLLKLVECHRALGSFR